LQEAQGQVKHLLKEINQGVHDGCEVWAFMDNVVWMVVHTKGHMSLAKHFFYLVLKLKLTHVFVCQWLFYQEEWWIQFEKEVHLWFTLSTGEAWPNSCFEPQFDW